VTTAWIVGLLRVVRLDGLNLREDSLTGLFL